jgi:signal transduction histidine kinase
MTAFWIADHLYLARNLGGGKNPQAEGCLLDWNQLKPTLIESVRDLLPEADLVPLAPDEPGDHQTLANLPIRLVPGEPVLGNLPVSSALKPTLIVAWSCFLLGSVALGILLFGVVRLSERRAAFVSAVTHELRTPLTTFRLYSDLLANRDSITREKYDRYIETLKNEAERLEYLIENVLSWSRLERSAETQLIEEIDWTEFFERIESPLRDRAAQAGMSLEVAEAEQESPLRFRGNRTAVERILFNLIDNACKYAKHADDKRIHLELSREERNVKISIRDHGPGIAAEVRPRLFSSRSPNRQRKPPVPPPASASASPSPADWPATWEVI